MSYKNASFNMIIKDNHTMSGSKDKPVREKISITKDAINDLPMIYWEGEVCVLDSLESMESCVVKLLNETHLGFDTETRPTFKKGDYHPPALIQLASETCVYLFRICKINTIKPLLPILESSIILKTGVAIKNDVKELLTMQEFNPRGFLDLTEITVPLGYENRGLRALAGLLLGGRISKAAQVSNWGRSHLDQKQIQYAATDAWISREIYRKALIEKCSEKVI